MTAIGRITLAAVAMAAVVVAAQAQDKAPAKDGKAIFEANKCNTCHTVEAQGITKKKADAADEKDEKSDKKAPDLSSVGLERKAPWMSKYLMKTEAIKGEKHGRKFRGTPDELATLSAWLETQQKAKKK